MQLFENIKRAFSSDIIQEVLTNMMESLDYGFRVRRAILETE
jgi:hypothetical protein